MTIHESKTFRMGYKDPWLGTNAATSSSGASGLRLAWHEPGRLSPDCADGSVGGLLLPRGMTLDERYRLFLLSEKCVLAFDGEASGFVPVVDLPTKPVPQALTVVGGFLVVGADDGQSLNAYALTDKTTIKPIEFAADLHDIRVVDHVANSGFVDVLLEFVENNAPCAAIVRWDPRYSNQPCILQKRVDCGATRVGAGLEGELLLFYSTGAEHEQLRLIDLWHERALVKTGDPSVIRRRFEGPWIRCDENEMFFIPEFLWDKDHRWPDDGKKPLFVDDPHAFDAELAVAVDRERGMFNLHGERLKWGGAVPRHDPLYQRKGEWLSHTLDSGDYRCSWGLLRIAVRHMPRGTRITVYSATTDQDPKADQDPASDDKHSIHNIQKPLWQLCTTVTRADVEQSGEPLVWPVVIDGLLGGRHRLTGRYLQLKVKLEGDGFRTPVVRDISVDGPYSSFSEYLPAIYRSERESRNLLERLLAVPQTEWAQLEESLDGYADHLDPRRVPAGEPLRFLASWVDAPVDLARSDTEQRRLLEAAVKMTNRRGCVDAIREFAKAMTWPDAAGHIPGGDQHPRDHELPIVLEGFQERAGVVLASGAGEKDSPSKLSGEAPLGGGAKVTSVAAKGDFVLDRSKLDCGSLVGETAYEASYFRRHAFRFEVFVPTAWLVNNQNESRLRELIDRIKPAHTSFRVRGVDAGIRVGCQSRVGVDTLIGEPPKYVLSDVTAHRGVRLGDGTRLGAKPRYPDAMPELRVKMRTMVL